MIDFCLFFKKSLSQVFGPNKIVHYSTVDFVHWKKVHYLKEVAYPTVNIAKFDYKIKSGGSRYLSKKGSVKFHKNYLELYNLLFSYSLWEARYKL